MSDFINLPNDQKTVSVCLEAVKKDPKNANFVPYETLNTIMSSKDSANDFFANEHVYRHLPADYLEKNKETLIWNAVIANPKSLKYIAEEDLTYDVCYYACVQDGNVLPYVPSRKQKEYIIIAALISAPENAEELVASLKRNRQTLNVYKKMVEVQQNLEFFGFNISKTSQEERKKLLGEKSDWTYSFAEKLLVHHPEDIEIVPKRYQTTEMLQSIIRQNPNAIKYLDERLCTEDVLKNIFMNEKFSDKEFFLKADSALIEECVLKRPELIKFLPEGKITKEMAEAVAKTGNADLITCIPGRFFTLQFLKRFAANSETIDKILTKMSREVIQELAKRYIMSGIRSDETSENVAKKEDTPQAAPVNEPVSEVFIDDDDDDFEEVQSSKPEETQSSAAAEEKAQENIETDDDDTDDCEESSEDDNADEDNDESQEVLEEPQSSEEEVEDTSSEEESVKTEETQSSVSDEETVNNDDETKESHTSHEEPESSKESEEPVKTEVPQSFLSTPIKDPNSGLFPKSMSLRTKEKTYEISLVLKNPQGEKALYSYVLNDETKFCELTPHDKGQYSCRLVADPEVWLK